MNRSKSSKFNGIALMKLAVVVSAASGALLFTSCTLAQYVGFQNNTGSDAVLEVVRNGLTNKHRLARGHYVELPNIELSSISISTNKWTYDAVPIPRDYVGSRSLSSRLIRYQIEKDGSLYLLMPSDTPPAPRFVYQPRGFPLKPKSADHSASAQTDSTLSANFTP
jgi:hypothetical protein